MSGRVDKWIEREWMIKPVNSIATPYRRSRRRIAINQTVNEHFAHVTHAAFQDP